MNDCILLNETEIITITSIKYLGVYIDQILDWNIHLEDKYHIATKRLSCFDTNSGFFNFFCNLEAKLDKIIKDKQNSSSRLIILVKTICENFWNYLSFS